MRLIRVKGTIRQNSAGNLNLVSKTRGLICCLDWLERLLHRPLDEGDRIELSLFDSKVSGSTLIKFYRPAIYLRYVHTWGEEGYLYDNVDTWVRGNLELDKEYYVKGRLLKCRS